MATGKLCRAALAAALAAVSLPATAADRTPSGPGYAFEGKEDATARSCDVVLTFGDGPATVDFRLILVRGKASGDRYVGFSVALTDARRARMHLASAAFTGAGFSSAAQLAGAPLDSGEVVAGTADPKVAAALTAAFFGGNFTLTLVEAGTAGARTYRLPAGPPLKVRQRFDVCAARAG